MDVRFNAIIDKLNNCENNSTLINFWKNYLLEQKNKLERSITNCEKIIEENADRNIDYNTILTMYFLNSNMVNDLNE